MLQAVIIHCGINVPCIDIDGNNIGYGIGVLASEFNSGTENLVNVDFIDANGNEINKYSYDEYFAFFQVMGDRLIFTKPFSEKQMWWNNIDNIENIFEGAIYIGTFVGAEHDVVD